MAKGARRRLDQINGNGAGAAFRSVALGCSSPLRDWRIASGLSQAEAAMVFGVGRRHLSRMENGLWPYPQSMLSGGGDYKSEWFQEVPLVQIDLVDDRQLVVACDRGCVAAVIADLSSGAQGFAAVVDLDDVLIVRRSKIALVTELKGTGLCVATCDDDKGLEGTSTLRLLSPSDWCVDDRAGVTREPGSVCVTASIDGRCVPIGSAIAAFVDGLSPLTLDDPEHGVVSVPVQGVDALMVRLDLAHPGFREDERVGGGFGPISLGRSDHSADVISIKDGRGPRRDRR